jgi:DNA-binding XRE family transcriptional regulator
VNPGRSRCPGLATVDPVKRADLRMLSGIRDELADGRARDARVAAGIRQREIASALGVAPSTVSQWEAGKRVPSAVHALAYGRLLRQLAKRAA